MRVSVIQNNSAMMCGHGGSGHTQGGRSEQSHFDRDLLARNLVGYWCERGGNLKPKGLSTARAVPRSFFGSGVEGGSEARA